LLMSSNLLFNLINLMDMVVGGGVDCWIIFRTRKKRTNFGFLNFQVFI